MAKKFREHHSALPTTIIHTTKFQVVQASKWLALLRAFGITHKRHPVNDDGSKKLLNVALLQLPLLYVQGK